MCYDSGTGKCRGWCACAGRLALLIVICLGRELSGVIVELVAGFVTGIARPGGVGGSSRWDVRVPGGITQWDMLLSLGGC